MRFERVQGRRGIRDWKNWLAWMTALAVLWMLALMQGHGQTQINPGPGSGNQIQWPKIVQAGTPTALGYACTANNVGQPYQNSAVVPNTSWTCAKTGTTSYGWQLVTGSSGGGSSAVNAIIPGTNITCSPNVAGQCTGNVTLNAPAGGLSGQTTSCAPKANSATTSTSSLPICDDGTTTTISHPLTVTGGGTPSVSIPGTTSGTATIRATAIAGTPTLSLPTTTGTLSRIEDFAAPPAVGDTTPAPSVAKKAGATLPATPSDCIYSGRIVFGHVCNFTEMDDTAPWVPNSQSYGGNGTELITGGGGGETWDGPGVSIYAEDKTASLAQFGFDIGDSSLVNGMGLTGSKNGLGDVYPRGYDYFGCRAGILSADEGCGLHYSWFGEMGPMSATVDASSSGQVIVPNSPGCTWGLPAVQSCQPSQGSRMVDTTTAITGRFTAAPTTADFSAHSCGFVNWIESIATNASIPALTTYGCTATADILAFHGSVSGTTLTYTSGQVPNSTWNGVQAAISNGSSISNVVLSGCTSSGCTTTPATGYSGAVTGGLQLRGDSPVTQTITFTGGLSTFAPGDFVCVIGHANNDYGGFDIPGIIEQSYVSTVSGSAGAQTITLPLAKPNGQVLVIKGGCGYVSLDANLYTGYTGQSGYNPGYIGLSGSLDGSSMLLVSEISSNTGLFTIPNPNMEPAVAAANPNFQATHAYSANDLIFDQTAHCGGAGCVWKIVTPGTSGGSAPAWTDFSSSTTPIAVGSATASNIGPATLFHLYPNAARVVANNYVTAGRSKIYQSSTLEPFAAGAFASTHAITDPNFDAQATGEYKDQQQCLSASGLSSCLPRTIYVEGPGAVNNTADAAALTIKNGNPLSMYYANGTLANSMIREPLDGIHIQGYGSTVGVYHDTIYSESFPTNALLDLGQPLTGQTSMVLYQTLSWPGTITVDSSGNIDFTNGFTVKVGGNTVCVAGVSTSGCGSLSGTVSANTIPKMNSGGTALTNSGFTDDGANAATTLPFQSPSLIANAVSSIGPSANGTLIVQGDQYGSFNDAIGKCAFAGGNASSNAGSLFCHSSNAQGAGLWMPGNQAAIGVGYTIGDTIPNGFSIKSGYNFTTSGLTGYLYGNGSSPVTASTTIPATATQKGNFVARSQTTATTTHTLVTAPATALYRINASASCDSVAAASTFTLTVGWTDPSNTADTQSVSGVDCGTLGAASNGAIILPVNALTGTNITVAVSITGTPTYDVAATVEQLTSN